MAHEISGRDLILLSGGLFLIWKSAHGIHQRLEGQSGLERSARGVTTMSTALLQIAILDIGFSLDSVITAVGMANEIAVMIVASVIAVGFMMFTLGGECLRGAASNGENARVELRSAQRGREFAEQEHVAPEDLRPNIGWAVLNKRPERKSALRGLRLRVVGVSKKAG